MAGRGMGAATKGGGCIGSGPKNKMVSKTSNKTGPVMMKEGGDVKIDMMPEDTPAERDFKKRMPEDTPAERDFKKKMAKATSKRYGGMAKKMRKGGMC